MNMSVEEYLIVICVLVAVLIYNKIKNSLPSQHETKKCEDKKRWQRWVSKKLKYFEHQKPTREFLDWGLSKSRI